MNLLEKIDDKNIKYLKCDPEEYRRTVRNSGVYNCFTTKLKNIQGKTHHRCENIMMKPNI